MPTPDDGAIPVDSPAPGADLVTNLITPAEFEAVVAEYLGRPRTETEISASPVNPLPEGVSE